ncbi:MAG: sulfotransferase [Pseudomonadota bacterium]
MESKAHTPDETLKSVQSEMQAGRFESAASQLDTLLASDPSHVDALYMRAVCARFLQDYSGAESRIEKLIEAAPEFGRAWQEKGHLFRDQGQTDAALPAYQLATRFNPALTASWKEQARLFASLGRAQEANAAAGQAAHLESLPKPLLAASNHMHEGRILRAEEVVRAFLQKLPKHVEGMRLLAEIGSRLGINDDAEFLLESALLLEPDNTQVRLDYMQVLRKRQKFDAALDQATQLVDRFPDNPTMLSHFAIENLQAGNYETALASFDQVLERIPGDPATLTSRGHALKTYGASEDAVASYRRAYESNPEHGEAFYALANLKTYRFSDDELAAMRAQADRADLAPAARIQFCFALGKAFEDRGEAGEAFTYYALGNELKRKQIRYTTESMMVELEAQKKHCTAALFQTQSGKGAPAPDPIFIVGLPRAGSTLLEQILASHSQVDGTLELPNILAAAHRLRGRKALTDRERYPRILHELSADQLTDLGRDYIDQTQTHRQGAAYFTDKMPNNFRHIGLIHLILPNAKIIDARRDPLDCCWSCFKQLFAEGQEFTYGLEDIGAYYKAYVDLMDHWDSVLPGGRILRVQHEDVLDDLDGEVRRILDYCGLPFEQNCVDFHTTERAVRTASSEQVRQPINRSGQGQWEPFEPYLDPLKLALGSDILPR